MDRTPKIARSIHSEKPLGSTYTDAQFSSKNSLLAGLPGKEFDQLNSCAQPFPMHAGQALADIATPVEYFYFPKSGVICTSNEGHSQWESQDSEPGDERRLCRPGWRLPCGRRFVIVGCWNIKDSILFGGRKEICNVT